MITNPVSQTLRPCGPAFRSHQILQPTQTKKAIRYDLKLPAGGPPDYPFEMWVDHAIVHETSPTYADDLLRFLRGPKKGKLIEGPAFRKMQQKKTNKYAALSATVNRLSAEHHLDFQPHFLFPTISSLGFLNSDFVTMNKFIVDRFRSTFSKTERTDGLSLKQLTGRFKVQMRNALCFALVKGNALSTWNQGLRHASKPP